MELWTSATLDENADIRAAIRLVYFTALSVQWALRPPDPLAVSKYLRDICFISGGFWRVMTLTLDLWTEDWPAGYFRSGERSHHRSIYKYLDTGLPSLSLAIDDPFKLTSSAQHASRWRMRGSQTCRLLHRPRGLARMRHRENRRDREFMLGNSRMKLPDAMHDG